MDLLREREPVRVRLCQISKHVNESFIFNFLNNNAGFLDCNKVNSFSNSLIILLACQAAHIFNEFIFKFFKFSPIFEPDLISLGPCKYKIIKISLCYSPIFSTLSGWLYCPSVLYMGWVGAIHIFPVPS